MVETVGFCDVWAPDEFDNDGPNEDGPKAGSCMFDCDKVGLMLDGVSDVGRGCCSIGAEVVCE